MARYTETPTLTPNNRIYLYRLLSSELGCGKQTFITAVEEALASDRMTADDLGYESTRALLEALEEFVKLTVFKGGRIYATVVAQPEWDAALVAADAGKSDAAAKGGRPWKRKKADKSLKPVRPKRVKRTEPVVEAMIEAAPESEAAKATPETKATADTEAETVTEAAPEPEIAPVDEVAAVAEPEAEPVAEPEAVAALENAADAEHAEEMDVEDQKPSEPYVEPAISITVTYNPYTGSDNETVLVSNPIVTPGETSAAPEPEPNSTPAERAIESVFPEPEIASQDCRFFNRTTETCAHAMELDDADSIVAAAPSPDPAPEPRPTSASEPAAQPRDDRPSPEALASYPNDLSTEVYLASEVVTDLCEMLPYGTDVFGLLAEDYTRARSLELLRGTRAKVTFPLRVEHHDSTDPIAVTLKKRSGSGLRWELSEVL